MSGLAKRPLKILCLHGYRQNDITFREKLGAFRKMVGKYCEFTFVTAPHPVLPMGHEDINQVCDRPHYFVTSVSKANPQEVVFSIYNVLM